MQAGRANKKLGKMRLSVATLFYKSGTKKEILSDLAGDDGDSPKNEAEICRADENSPDF